MSDPTIVALKRLIVREGGYKAVARVIGANPQSLYQICAGVRNPSGKPKGVGQKLRERLQRHYPDWMLLGSDVLMESPARFDAGADIGARLHTFSTNIHSHPTKRSVKMPPPKMHWESLMTAALPPEFETELPDNAMAPAAPSGTRVIFVTGVTPEAGDWVLLTDKLGTLACREMRIVRPGHWQAHAVNPAVMPMDSVRDGLKVLAVYDGMRGRRAPR
jgi:hypothetical protein